jgi:Na+/H+ antiporter NhaD/arsenite permease-like protein
LVLVGDPDRNSGAHDAGTSEQLTMRVFWLSTVLTYFTSNDMVIVSLTPLILELCNQSKRMKPLPMLIAKFIAANTSSIVRLQCK